LFHCDVVFPNEAEARLIAGQDNLDNALDTLDALRTQVSTVAVKLGAAGGLARQGGQTVRAPAPPVQVVDTTGAGDSFDAGFLYGFLHDWTLERMLRLACACGSLSTQVSGGTDGQPTLKEALDALA
jgi:sugar/nucleoside kinase (ribokinase family)